jgi:hypothetical protein
VAPAIGGSYVAGMVAPLTLVALAWDRRRGMSTAPITVRISHGGQPVRLALGYPAAAITVALTLDTDGRISTETLTDRTHLIHRRFAYPGHD